MTNGAEEQDPLDALAEEFTTSLRGGDPPDIDGWAERHPDHATAIRELFPTIVAMEGVKEATRASRPFATLPGTIERLGDFRILGEIGRGGMGVVYEAEQESLGRRVALKVLPQLRDPRRQRRFERETRMAARLHHTNIVPIYGVGDAEGFSYYVMPVIRGVSLDVVIDALRGDLRDDGTEPPEPGTLNRLAPIEAVRALRTGWFRPATGPASSTDSSATNTATPSDPTHREDPRPEDPGQPLDTRARYWHSVADAGRQVADALAHAHHVGVLHRDVKPANLLLDAQGVVWVTDFGLAKAVGHDAGLTHSGDLVGTLQYMAPEQLHGAYDVRSDLHALGLTLYELLTLTPAYAATDRGTLLKRVAESSPARPTQLRDGIPHDLETIVLKAIQPDPTHRYQTADEFRADLEAFLEDRPIRARRVTALEYGWRWCRRNRLVAGLAGVALVAIVGAAVTGWSAWATTRSALRREAAAAEDARESSRRARDNLALARQVFEGVFDRIAGPDRLEVVVDDDGEGGTGAVIDVAPVAVSEQDAALLEDLLGFYDRFAASNAGDAGLRLDAAKAYRRVGDIHLQLGRVDAATEAYERALSNVVDLDGGEGTHALTIAAIHNDLGRARRASGDGDGAIRTHELALTLLADAGDTAPVLLERARSHEYLAHVALRRRPRMRSSERRSMGEGRRQAFERARKHQLEAYELYRQLAESQPDNATIELAAVGAALQLGLILAREEEGRRILTEAIARLEQLVESRPDVAAYRRELAQVYLALTMRRGTDDSSREIVDRTIELAESLHAESPGDESYRRMLAAGLWRRAERSLPRDRAEADPQVLASAREDLSRAIALDDELWPARRRYIAVLEAQGESDLALSERQRWLEQMLERFSDQPERGNRMSHRIASELRSLADALRERGDTARADEADRRAEALER